MAGLLDGQHAIVIGGGSGIGLGSARLLARDGARVTIAGRTEQKLRDAVATLADEGLTAGYAPSDCRRGSRWRRDQAGAAVR
jgi:NAD(P)-dependent dehydrogenase (short-subunit alcohol dehydrogenase family)